MMPAGERAAPTALPSHLVLFRQRRSRRPKMSRDPTFGRPAQRYRAAGSSGDTLDKT
jgi:hypothetical protein